MTVARPKGERHDCCIGGWSYVLPYGWIICADHEEEAATNGQPDDYFIGWFKMWQPGVLKNERR